MALLCHCCILISQRVCLYFFYASLVSPGGASLAFIPDVVADPMDDLAPGGGPGGSSGGRRGDKDRSMGSSKEEG